MSIKTVSIDSSIKDKILWAKEICHAKRDQFLRDKNINDLLKKYKDAANISLIEMNRVGISDECKICEEREGGSCCGKGIENKYSGTLLLVNLLLGCELPLCRHDPKGCYFLGEKGCTLQAKHVICVNYICKKITEKINHKELIELRDAEGVELEILFLLNERLKNVPNGK